jgi:hypothetical protein
MLPLVLREIVLSNVNLQGKIPAAVSALTKLTYVPHPMDSL